MEFERRKHQTEVYLAVLSLLFAVLVQICVMCYWAGRITASVEAINGRVMRIEQQMDLHLKESEAQH